MTSSVKTEMTSGSLQAMGIAIGYIVLVCLLGPWWNVYQFNNDEGINLMKASLVAAGFELYSDIWSDQPPLVTGILTLVHTASGGSVNAARLVILGFSTLTLVGVFVLVRRHFGNYAAWISVSLLTTSQILLKNSVSVLIGIPAVSIAVVSMALVPESGARAMLFRVFLAGVIFSLSLHAKMFTFLLLPAFLLLVLQSGVQNSRSFLDKAGLQHLAMAFIGIASLALFMSLLRGGLFFEQLVASHSKARDVSTFAGQGGFDSIYRILRRSEFPALVFGVTGAIFAIALRDRRALVPLVWLLVAAIALIYHRPLWKHQLVLVIVPMCWLGGFAVARGAATLVGIFRPSKLATFILLSLAPAMIAWWSQKAIVFTHQRFNEIQTEVESMHRLAWFDINNRMVFTDLPLDAYRAGKLVPPEVAVLSEKRIRAGNLTGDDLIHIVESRVPGQFSMGRDIVPRSFSDWLALNGSSTQQYSMRSILANKGNHFHLAWPETYRPLFDARAASDGQGNISPDDFEQVNALVSTLFDIVYLHRTTGLGGVHFHQHKHRYDGFTDGVLLGSDQVVARPPQSAQQIGQCMVDSYRATGWKKPLEEAVRIARALACTQDKQGGWATVSTMPDGCLEGQGPVTRRDDGDQTFDKEILDSVVEFVESLVFELEELSIDVPNWLVAMNNDARAALVELSPGTEKSLVEYIDPTFTVPQFDIESLSADNPDGFQTTRDLVNQCYAVIRDLQS